MARTPLRAANGSSGGDFLVNNRVVGKMLTNWVVRLSNNKFELWNKPKFVGGITRSSNASNGGSVRSSNSTPRWVGSNQIANVSHCLVGSAFVVFLWFSSFSKASVNGGGAAKKDFQKDAEVIELIHATFQNQKERNDLAIPSQCTYHDEWWIAFSKE